MILTCIVESFDEPPRPELVRACETLARRGSARYGDADDSDETDAGAPIHASQDGRRRHVDRGTLAVTRVDRNEPVGRIPRRVLGSGSGTSRARTEP